MNGGLPVADIHAAGLIERRRTVRFTVLRPIVGRTSPADQPLTLHNIGDGGFSARAESNLVLGAAYDCQFVIPPYTIVVRARLAHAMRANSDSKVGYLLGFEFLDKQRDQAGITALIARASRPPRVSQDAHPIIG